MPGDVTEISPVIGMIGAGAYVTDSPKTFLLKHKSRIGFNFSVDDAEGNRVFSVMRINFHRLVVLDMKTQIVGSLDISFPRPSDRAILRPDDSTLFQIRAKTFVPSFTTELDLFTDGEDEPSVIVQHKEGTHEDVYVICNQTKQELAKMQYSSGKLPHSDTLTITVPAGGDYALASFIALAAHAIYHF